MSVNSIRRCSSLGALGCILVVFVSSLWSQDKVPQTEKAAESTPASSSADASASDWQEVLTPESYAANWMVTPYGGEGEAELKDGVLKLQPGVPLTGIHWKADNFPKENYEVRFKAQRVEGNDFLGCLTFPVGSEFCSVVIGGWGGGVVGISSINGNDASENETTQFMSFENKQWYAFHLTVTNKQIVFKVNDDTMIDVSREGNKFDTRIEVIRARPFGFCNYQCVTQVKEFAYRSLKAEGEAPAKAGGSPKPLFVRVESNDQDVMQSLQTAISSYSIANGEFAGAKIDLIGAVHVGEVSYYQELNERFKTYDAVLFELVADPEIRIENRKDQEGVINPVSSLQVGMKDSLELEFQLDQINYSAKNFVHADMTPEEFMVDMRKRKDSFVSMFARVLGASIAAQSDTGNQDAALLAAMLQPDRTMALRRVFAQQLEKADVQLAGVEDASGLSTLVTERNAKAMDVLRKQLGKGQRKLAIFYGAAHLEDMHQKLLKDFQAQPDKTEWLVAWKLK